MYKNFIIFTLVIISITGCDRKSSNSVKSNGRSVDNKIISEVMLFLTSQSEFDARIVDHRVTKNNFEIAGRPFNDTMTDHTLEDYKSFDFKYNPETKTLSWKEICNRTSYINNTFTMSVSGTDTASQINYTMPLTGFSGFIKEEKTKSFGTVNLLIPQSADCIIYQEEQKTGREGSLSPRPGPHFSSDQKLETKNLENLRKPNCTITVENDLAPRLKRALEDLFKAHGANMSKY